MMPNAPKERRPALQGRNKLQKNGKGYPSLPETQRRKRQLWSMLGPSPSLAGWVCGSYSFTSIKLLGRNEVVPGHKFGESSTVKAGERKYKT